MYTMSINFSKCGAAMIPLISNYMRVLPLRRYWHGWRDARDLCAVCGLEFTIDGVRRGVIANKSPQYIKGYLAFIDKQSRKEHYNG